MNSVARQGLAPGLSQRPSLVPGLADSLRLLTLSGIELEQAVESALENNIMLEREEPGEVFDELPAIAWTGPAPRFEPEPGEDTRCEEPDLRTHLMTQLSLEHFHGTDRAIAEAVIDALDEDGYLRTPESMLIETLSELEPAPGSEELNMVIHRVQCLEPTGVAARSCAECLRLQLAERPAESSVRRCAQRLLDEHFQELGKARPEQLARRLCVPRARLAAALALIQKLDPHPGYRFSTARIEYLVPELVALREGVGWQVVLNPAVTPQLRVNRLYSDCLPRRRAQAEGVEDESLHDQARDARTLVSNLANRRDTLLKVGEALIRHQAAFLDSGPTRLAPLAMHTVASELNLHESTISRAVQGKSIATPRGTIPLRHFFAASLSNSNGEASSSRAVQARIKALIAKEDAHAPMSDAALVAALEASGILVARRTVAKYREALGFASTRERRRPRRA